MKAKDIIRWRGDMAPSKVISKVPPQLQNKRPKGEAIKEILAFIETHPGTNIREVSAAIGYKSAQPTLNKMAKQGRIVQKRLDGMLRYYPAGVMIQKKPVGNRSAGQSQEMMLEYVTTNPGCTVREITKHMGWQNDSSTRTMLYLLEKKGLVERRFEGGKNRMYPSNKVATPDFIVVNDLEEAGLPAKKKADIHPDYRRLAQEYAWDNPEALGVLKSFVVWLEGRDAK